MLIFFRFNDLSCFIPHFHHHGKSCLYEPFSTAKVRRFNPYREQGRDKFHETNSAAGFHENSFREILGYSADFLPEILASKTSRNPLLKKKTRQLILNVMEQKRSIT